MYSIVLNLFFFAAIYNSVNETDFETPAVGTQSGATLRILTTTPIEKLCSRAGMHNIRNQILPSIMSQNVLAHHEVWVVHPCSRESKILTFKYRSKFKLPKKDITPGVNFINILRALFCRYPFAKKIQSKIQLEKGCAKHFRMKNTRVKCWWNWLRILT